MLPAVGELLNANPSAWRLSGEICFSAARRKICALNDQSPENFRSPAMLADCRTQQREVRADTDRLRGGTWFRGYLYILCFVNLNLCPVLLLLDSPPRTLCVLKEGSSFSTDERKTPSLTTHVSGLSNPACDARVPYYIVVCSLTGSAIFFHIISRTSRLSEIATEHRM